MIHNIGTPSDPRQVKICPECATGKHRNCDGTVWDFDKDELTECECAQHWQGKV
jgi:hypothetical protein